MIQALDRQMSDTLAGLHSSMLNGEAAESVKRVQIREDMSELEYSCRSKLSELQSELDQLLAELSQSLKSQ